MNSGILTILLIVYGFQAEAGLLPKNAFSNKALGTTAAGFLKLSVSPRNSALADSIIPSLSDPLGGFSSPAAYAAFPGRAHLSLGGGVLPEDIIETAATVGLPRYPGGKWTLNIHQIIQPSLGLFDPQGTKTGQFSPSDSAIGAAYGSRRDEIIWGASLSYLHSRIGPGLSGSGLASNLGVYFPEGYFFEDRNLSLALALLNMGPPANWGSQTAPLPMKGQAEVSYKLIDKLSALNLGVALPADQSVYGLASLEWRIPLGGENKFSYNPSQSFSARLGISSKNKTQSLAGKLSFGFGLALGSLAIDASIASFGNLGFFPRLGINFAF